MGALNSVIIVFLAPRHLAKDYNYLTRGNYVSHTVAEPGFAHFREEHYTITLEIYCFQNYKHRNIHTPPFVAKLFVDCHENRPDISNEQFP